MADYYLSPVVDGETFEPLVKVGDTLEIGTEVYYDGAEVPEGWEQVDDPVGDLTDLDTTTKTDLVSAINEVNSLVTPVTLYNNASGTTSTITLSETAANFSYIDIIYSKNTAVGYSTTRVYEPNTKNVNLTEIDTNVADYISIYGCSITINGTSLTFNNGKGVALTSTGVDGFSNNNEVKIYKVIGYK